MTAIRRIVYEFVVPVDGAGTTATYRFATHGFRTKPTDTPPNTHIAERIKSAGGWRKDLFGGGRLGNFVSPAYGAVTLNNEDGELDSFARFSGGGGSVRALLGDDSLAFPDGYFVLLTAEIATALPDFESIVINLQDGSSALNAPIVSATFAGSGGLEGQAGLSRKKQLVFGEPGLIPLIEIDRANQVYFVQANATSQQAFAGLSAFGLTFEGGVPVRRDAALPFADDLFSEVYPDPGGYRPWAGYFGGSVSLGGGGTIFFGSAADAETSTPGPFYLRLGTPPTGELRFGATGLLSNGGEAPRRWMFTDLCNRAGLPDVVPWDLGIIAGRTEDFDCGNRLIDGDQTYAAVMADRCRAVLGTCGFTRLGKFYCATLRAASDGDEPSAYNFTVNNSRDFRRELLSGLERPFWRVTVKAGRTWPQTPNEAASAEMRDILTRQQWATEFSGTSAAAKLAYPNAMVMALEIDGNDFKTREEQQAFVEAFGRLFGAQPDFISLSALDFSEAVLSMELLERVTLTLPRFSYAAGRQMRVARMEADFDSREVRFLLWGQLDEPGAWALGGGAYPDGAGEPGGSWGGPRPPASLAPPADRSARMEDFYSEFFGGQSAVAFWSGELEDMAQESDAEFTAAAGVGLTWFEAEDQFPDDAVTAGPAAERAAFMAMLTVSGSEGFEGAPYEPGWSMDGESFTVNGVTATVSTGVIEGISPDFWEEGDPTNYAGRFNTTSPPFPDSYRWLGFGAALTMTSITFSTPIAAFGFYATDMGDFSGQVSVTLHKSGGGTVNHDIAHTVNGDNGSLMFFGFVDDTDTYTQIDIKATTTAEFIGIDDVVIATAAQLA